ncbi:MAG: RNase adapter RapZ [Erysipelotrichaceae bacterium]
MKPQNVVLITGMSGAGKSSAMSVLEDIGYHCIDQFPVQLISHLGEIIHPNYELRYCNIALATTAIDYPKFIQFFEQNNIKVKVLYLDASNETLLLRYKFTRRHHPFLLANRANTLEEAIECERELFTNIFETATMHLDTTKLSIGELKGMLETKLSLSKTASFSVSFISFGFKHGVPLDADLIFDMRILPNPYYIKELRPQTGNDAPVYDYVMGFEETKSLLQVLEQYLNLTLASYANGAKNHITVGIGCTGGQHRSVSVANYLYHKYEQLYPCYISHRDTKDAL